MKKVAASCSGTSSTFFLILVLAVSFLLIYAYAGPMTSIFSKTEKFRNDQGLIPADKLIVLQGNTLPDVQIPAVRYDNHESLPPIDGTDDGAKAMFMLAYNKCDPSCCPSTYSCNGGCVCMTKEQQNFIGTRGHNSKTARCGEAEY